jgi:hypothetical protein
LLSRLAIFEKAEIFGARLAARGHHIVYRTNETNRCPGCGHANWYIGRITAECSFCGAAIALAETVLSVDAAPGKSGSRRAEDTLWNERRREERVTVGGRSVELLRDGSLETFAIQNVSQGGLMGRGSGGMPPGTALRVRMDDGTFVSAVVRWAEGDLVGLSFEETVEPDQNLPLGRKQRSKRSKPASDRSAA